MIVEVHYVGNEFVAYDEQGNRISDRTILDQISFDQFPGYNAVVKLKVDNATNPAIITPLGVNINVKTNQ